MIELIKIFEESLTYNEYRAHVDLLVAAGKTTGLNQSEALLEFTKLNIQRMNRLDKTIQLNPEQIAKLNQHKKTYNWLLIGDAWCGDCAQIVPIVNKVAECMEGAVDFKLISRDSYPQLIEKHLSNGAKAIPKLLMMHKDTNEVLLTWGPRPKPAQDIMLHWKENMDTITWEDFEKSLHLWYARDKGAYIINELVELLNQ
ncbi:MAG: thioredoxin family protein [bacterium]|nr:thioredoxin family protein [bacterium]